MRRSVEKQGARERERERGGRKEIKRERKVLETRESPFVPCLSCSLSHFVHAQDLSFSATPVAIPVFLSLSFSFFLPRCTSLSADKLPSSASVSRSLSVSLALSALRLFTLLILHSIHREITTYAPVSLVSPLLSFYLFFPLFFSNVFLCLFPLSFSLSVYLFPSSFFMPSLAFSVFFSR